MPWTFAGSVRISQWSEKMLLAGGERKRYFGAGLLSFGIGGLGGWEWSATPSVDFRQNGSLGLRSDW